jgi:Reverse transcriptase (RNA-dependent DNA polymerase)
MPDQSDSALVEGGRPGRWSSQSERGGNTAKRIDQRAVEQPVPPPHARPRFERVVKCRLRGEAHLVRYIDDFVICFQYRSDALRVQDALRLRLGKFGLTLEPTKTKLVEFGRFAQRHAGKRGRNRPETIYFLGLTLYCTRNRKGNFKVGMRIEKSRLRRSLLSLQELMRQIRHHRVSECCPTRPLRLLRRRREYPVAVESVSGRGALLRLLRSTAMAREHQQPCPGRQGQSPRLPLAARSRHHYLSDSGQNRHPATHLK